MWSSEEPPVLSGTVLPVYLRSTIEQVWVVGIPKELIIERTEPDKMEIPLTQFEFLGSRRKAESWAESFAEYALFYAENLQDGLPIRESPDNGARRVYRLRVGEVIKILSKARGNPPIGTTGEPLPGDWYKVLTLEGVTGFCFSNRLNIFEHKEGKIGGNGISPEADTGDKDLDNVMQTNWSPESYSQMINSNQINIGELQKKYRFDLSEDGIAGIFLPEIEREFLYDRIVSTGENAWRFTGGDAENRDLQMYLRSPSNLAVQFLDASDQRRTHVFVSLSSNIDNIISGEAERRNSLFREIYNQGPVFTSNNYGTIIFSENGRFQWTGYDLLVPEIIPSNTRGEGSVLMDLFITPSLSDQYPGAFTFNFRDGRTSIHFMYNLDHQGLRLELLPDYAIENITVTRRASSPIVLYFFIDS